MATIQVVLDKELQAADQAARRTKQNRLCKADSEGE
jgi:hypothetical protein